MANTHRLKCDPVTDVISWAAFATLGGSDYILTIDRATDVIAWHTIDEGAVSTGWSYLGIDSATDVISWDNVT